MILFATQVRPVLEELLLERSKGLPENDNQQDAVLEDTGVKNKPHGSFNKWQSQDSDRYRSDGNKHFARYANDDKRRSQSGNDVCNGGKGSSRANREGNQHMNSGVKSGMGGGVKNNNKQDVDEDQYER